jgi:alkaline phosphatase D
MAMSRTRPFDPRRRLVLGAAAALGACAVAPQVGDPPPAKPFKSDPFTLGVASGYPLPDAVALWTMLAPDDVDDAAELGKGDVAVDWILAEDPALARVVAKGRAPALRELAHSVHVEAGGLRSGRDYWYRFAAGGMASAVGHTRTAPSTMDRPARHRLAFASCQQYEQGWYVAYRDMAAQDLDLAVHVGDYIYESSWGSHHVRRHTGGIPTTLPEFRARYALYKRDPDLRAAHAACPWLVAWDDHEVANDYTNDVSPRTRDPQAFLAIRAAAYQAWYEHMPVPASFRPRGPDARIYGQYRFGDLVDVTMLDGRQYRSQHACLPGTSTSPLVDCAERHSPSRTFLGSAQEQWFAERMRTSDALWSVVAQTTLVAEVDRKPGPEHGYWMDGWDGYTASRTKLVDALAAQRHRNAIVVGGDVHAFWASDLRRDFAERHAAAVATEFVGGAITSQGSSPATIAALLAKNPQLRYGRADRRGYGILTLERSGASVEFRAVDDEKDRQSAVRTLARFAIENGRPGVREAG